MSYRLLLREELERRRQKHRRYSLSALARDLGLTPAALSLVLSDRRHLSKRTLLHIAERLNWDQFKLDSALAEITRPFKERPSHRVKITEREFNVVSDWFFWAVRSLAQIESNRATPEWIAKRLGISRANAKEAVETLVEMGVIEVEDDRMKPITGKEIYFVPTTKEVSRKLHLQALDRAAQVIQDSSTPDEERLELFGTVVASNSEIKAIEHQVRQFSNSVRKITSERASGEVYGVMVHVFPLTRSIKD